MALLFYGNEKHLCSCAVARQMVRKYGASVVYSTPKKYAISVGDKGYKEFRKLVPKRTGAETP